MKKYIKGFTLIELLVVIAIIGILSSIVLVSLNTARQKGIAARIQADATNIRTSLETASTGSVYPDLVTTAAAPIAGAQDLYTAGSFAGTGNLAVLKTDIITTEGGKLQIWDSCGGVACTAVNTVSAYSIVVTFPGGGGYCVDSTGFTKPLTSATANTLTSASQVTTCAAATAI